MSRLRVRLTLAALLAAMAGAAFAESQARLHGTIKDETGAPLAGVAVTVTQPELPTFLIETKSDAKGRYGVTLNDATRSYLYRLAKEGYQTVEATIKVGVGQNKQWDFELLSLAEAERRAAAGGVKRELTPKEKAVLAFNAGAEAAQAHDAAAARARFEEAFALDPELAAAASALAGLAMVDGDHAGAVGWAERALAADPGDRRALMIRYEAFRALGDEEKARAAGEALAAADPATAAAEFFNRGVELYNEGKTGEALPQFERAVAADPQLAKARYLLALCYVNAGQPARAKAELEAFLELAPDDPDAPAAREMLGYL